MTIFHMGNNSIPKSGGTQQQMTASPAEITTRLLQTILGLASCVLVLLVATTNPPATSLAGNSTPSIKPIVFIYLAFGLILYTTLLSAFLLLDAVWDITNYFLSYVPSCIPVWLRRGASIGSVLLDLVFITIWGGITTLLLSHILYGRACVGVVGDGRLCSMALALLGLSVGQNVLCLVGLVLSAGRVADRDTAIESNGIKEMNMV
jgi:hypothetical protein